MHIPDGFTTLPVNAACGAVSALAVAAGLWRSRRLGEKQVPLVGVTGSFIFAAQMLNFPVLPGISGHFLGATFAAILLGPLEACLIMAVVLTIQCLIFGDGGLMALGTNLLNMGVIGAILGYYIFRAIRLVLPQSRPAFSLAAGIAAWCSVMLGATACSAELVLSGVEPADKVFEMMLGVHALIGIGEGLITASVVGMVLTARPDLVGAWQPRIAGAAP